MLIDLVEFPWYSLPLFAGFFVLSWKIFLRRAIPSFFDPLNFGMNLTTAGTLTVYTAMKLEGSLKGWEGIHVPFFTFLILLSIRIGAVLPIRNVLTGMVRWVERKDGRDDEMSWVSGILFFLAVAGVFMAKFGMPLLYENPLHSKMMYSGGDGSIRRVLQAALVFVQLSSVSIYIHQRRKVALVVFFVASLLTSALVVSKSALIGSLFLLLFFLNIHGESRLNKYVIPMIPIGLAFSLLTIYLGLKSVLPNVEMSLVLNSFVTRVIAFGDSSFYLLDTNKIQNAFRNDDIFSLLRTNFAPLLAALRMISWDDAPSTGGRIYAAIVGFYTGIGPNSTLQVEGWLYLGWLGGLYCFFSGIIILLLRRISLIVVCFGDAYMSFFGVTIFFGVTSAFADGSFWGTLGVSLLFSLGTAVGIYSMYLLLLVLMCRKVRARKLFCLGRFV